MHETPGKRTSADWKLFQMKHLPGWLLMTFALWQGLNVADGFLVSSAQKLFSLQASRGLHFNKQTRMPQKFVTQAKLGAIIFACDGVLVDSERDGHRVALNAAMKEVRPDLECSVEEYGRLLQVRGEEKLSRYAIFMGSLIDCFNAIGSGKRWDGME
eukprot:753947-Hanusia_phi.AAC.5